VVGAGFAGLGLAVKLSEGAGTSVGCDFIVIDRGADVGGTWRDNTYPGATCDVPSQLYSFSFALNPEWSRSFSSQSEIQEYLRAVASRSGVLDRFRFGVELLAAEWDCAAALWRIDTSAGRCTAKVLVSATGALSSPRLPEFEGMDSFTGALFHSANWNHRIDLTGKHVAVIGTGASAIQFVPEIVGRVAELDVYQRTATWVIRRRDRRISRAEKAIFRRVPAVQRFVRSMIYWVRECAVPAFTTQPKMMAPARWIGLANIRRGIADAGLRARVTPSFEFGCKRILMSNDWYPALSRPNVNLITSEISRITPTSIVTSAGAERAVEVIIMATGFSPTEPPVAHLVTGAAGRTLAEVWDQRGMQGYKGTTVAGFPNLFLLVGPNTGLGHSSVLVMIESQIAYVLDALKAMHRYKLASVEIHAAAQDRYNNDLMRRMERTVWTRGGCASWYFDAHGRNTTLWPRSTFAFRALTARFDVVNYRVVDCSGATDPMMPDSDKLP
jgi:cyclohexanone monooxygenase